MFFAIVHNGLMLAGGYSYVEAQTVQLDLQATLQIAVQVVLQFNR